MSALLVIIQPTWYHCMARTGISALKGLKLTYSRGQKKVYILFPLHGTKGVLKRKRNGNETETKR